MPLKLNLGPVELDADGDLAKHLVPGIDTVVNLFNTDLLALRIADVPSGSLGTKFTFSTAPTWQISQAVGISLSVAPGAGCTLSIRKPGDPLFEYSTGDDAEPTAVTVPDGRYYLSIGLECSLAVAAGAQWSGGNFGVSGNISTDDRFRVANHCWVLPSTTLRDAVVQAFSSFVLPFHSASISGMPDGNYIDFEFAGNLALGFGVTYGFSGLLLAGRSNGEVKASFGTPIGKAVVTAAPSFQVAAGFKLNYSHSDFFRVIAGRNADATRNGATLYLFRQDASTLSTTETFGITLNAGVQFQTDAAKLKSEIGKVTQKYLGAAAAPLGDRLASAADSLAGAINSSVNKLLAKGDGHKIELELIQSRTKAHTALFIYDFDFTQSGIEAYDCAMRGDYATAMTMPGAQLDPRSFIEQTYLQSAGLTLQLFGLLQFHDVTEYIQKNQVFYLGARTFQIRSTEGIKAISGLFGKEQEADLYFVARCKTGLDSVDVSDVDVRLQVIFLDKNNADAFRQSKSMLAALTETAAADALGHYTESHANGSVRLTFEGAASLFAALESDNYQNGRPPAEPHTRDAANYQQFAAAVRDTIGASDSAAATFLNSFSAYTDWLEFNRIKTDQAGSTQPGDRLSVGTAVVSLWPNGYPPSDSGARSLVQAYLYAGQHFMNFCDGLKRLAADLPSIDTQQEYDEMLKALRGMVRHEISFPTWFLKPGVVAMLRLSSARLTLQGSLPDSAADDFAVSFDAAGAAAAIRSAAPR
jgi:hypothetical protein